MDIKVDNLISKTGIDKELAELLLDFTNDDVDGAVKIIDAMPKDYSVLKMRFICQKTHYYGVLFLLINIKEKTIEETAILLDRNRDASKIDNSLTFDVFYSDIMRYKEKKGSDSELETRFKEEFQTDNFKESVISCYNFRKDMFELNQIKAVMDDLFFRALTESDLVIKIQEEKIDIFKYKKFKGLPLLNKKFLDTENENNLNKSDEYINSESQTVSEKNGTNDAVEKTAEEQKVKVYNISLVLLKIEPVVSPVKGIAVSDLQIGDTLKVKIIDDRDVGLYLNKLLGGVSELGDIVPVVGSVKSIEKNPDTDNYNVVVEFGPGIGGVMNVPGEIKILSPLTEELDKINRTFTLNTGIWIGIILLIILFIVFFIITVT